MNDVFAINVWSVFHYGQIFRIVLWFLGCRRLHLVRGMSGRGIIVISKAMKPPEHKYSNTARSQLRSSGHRYLKQSCEFNRREQREQGHSKYSEHTNSWNIQILPILEMAPKYLYQMPENWEWSSQAWRIASGWGLSSGISLDWCRTKQPAW